MGKGIVDLPSIEIVRASFIPNFQAGTVLGAERPRDHFETDCGFRLYNSTYAGKEALTVVSNGRSTGHYRFKDRRYLLIRARVIWALFHGEWPQSEIGHRNEILLDDRIENLREQTRSDSLITRRLTNCTGVVGVYPMRNGRFFARVTKDLKIHHVGCFDSVEEARIAREKAALELQGEFARVAEPTDQAAGVVS